MNKELFMAVCDRLRTEVPELRWIDAEMGQLEVKPRPPVAFPCCLVDMRYLQCVSQTAGTQRVRAQFALRVDGWIRPAFHRRIHLESFLHFFHRVGSDLHFTDGYTIRKFDSSRMQLDQTCISPTDTPTFFRIIHQSVGSDLHFTDGYTAPSGAR